VPLNVNQPTDKPVDDRPLTRTDETARDRAAAEWASRLLSAVADMRRVGGPMEPTAASSGGRGAAAPALAGLSADDGRPSALSKADPGSQTADTHGVNDGGPTRVRLEIATEDFGTLSVAIETTKDGISVVIGGEQAAQSALLLDRQALVDALSGGGTNLRSLRIVGKNELGTVLAQEPTNRKERAAAERKPSPFGETASKNPKRRRLDLIG
jgi:hypothetical protein